MSESFRGVAYCEVKNLKLKMANLISEFKTWNMFEILIKIYKEFHGRETKLNIYIYNVKILRFIKLRGKFKLR